MSSEVTDRRHYYPSIAELSEDAVADGPPVVQREGYRDMPRFGGAQNRLAPAVSQPAPLRRGGALRLNRRRV
jgi:hypothetical protein